MQSVLQSVAAIALRIDQIGAQSDVIASRSANPTAIDSRARALFGGRNVQIRAANTLLSDGGVGFNQFAA